MEEQGKVCCFTGHRILSNEEKDWLKRALRLELLRRIRDGYTLFVAGGARGFDTQAALSVLELRQRYTNIRLKLVLPCKEQYKGWHPKEKELFQRILQQADHVEYIADEYLPGCMQARNRRMVELSDGCISYQKRMGGGTGFTVNCAEEKGISIWNLAEQFMEMKEENISYNV